jgi:hypothetical protein
MIYAVIALVVTNLATLTILIRARYLNAQVTDKAESLLPWLKVHDQLQRASKSMIIIEQVNPSDVFYRGSGR